MDTMPQVLKGMEAKTAMAVQEEDGFYAVLKIGPLPTMEMATKLAEAMRAQLGPMVRMLGGLLGIR